MPLSQVHPLFTRGYLATDFFIIVSGYVLGRIYGERVLSAGIGMGDFFLRRAQRLVPAHLIVIAAFIVMLLVSGLIGLKPLHPEYLSWSDLPGELFLVQAFGVPGGEGWNSPTWSLSALLGCYGPVSADLAGAGEDPSARRGAGRGGGPAGAGRHGLQPRARRAGL